jgi:uncharacterized RDD family membrane protein YckC
VRPFQRRRQVTDEPLRIEPALMGWPLGTPWRRGAAFLTDLALFGLLYVLLVLGVACLTIQRSQPEFLPALAGFVGADEDSTQRRQALIWRTAVVDFVAERRPEALPDSVRAGLARDDRGPLERFVASLGEATTVGIETGDSPAPLYDPGSERLVLKLSLFLGPWARVLGAVSALIVYFTLATRVMRGRTPGKALWRLRVVRLDGRPLRWWDAFDRAGGYGASFSTACLGFLESLWHPNRQTVHDRIAGTVVIRTGAKAERQRDAWRGEREAGKPADDVEGARPGRPAAEPEHGKDSR